MSPPSRHGRSPGLAVRDDVILDAASRPYRAGERRAGVAVDVGAVLSGRPGRGPIGGAMTASATVGAPRPPRAGQWAPALSFPWPSEGLPGLGFLGGAFFTWIFFAWPGWSWWPPALGCCPAGL